MHLQMMQLFADGHAALQESATAVEETEVIVEHDRVYGVASRM